MTHSHLPTTPDATSQSASRQNAGAGRQSIGTSLGGALEHAPEDFVRAWGEYAAAGELLPRPEGSPLLEFVTMAGTPLYLLDRSGPYLPTGPCHMLLHALADPRATRALPAGQAQATPWLEAATRSQVRGVGRVLARGRGVLVLETCGQTGLSVPLLLSAPTLPPYPRGAWQLAGEVGQWLEFATLPPLHGFRVVHASAAQLRPQHHDE